MEKNMKVTAKDLERGCNFKVLCTPGFVTSFLSKAETAEEAIEEAKMTAWQATNFEVIDLRK